MIDRRPAVIAHRGASIAARENSIDAFERAGAMGSDAVELDVRRTRDGQAVVHHDAHLADGRALCELDLSEVPPSVPTLSDGLDACRGMWVNIEIKNIEGEVDHDPSQTLARAVMRELDRRGEADRWLISSFDMAAIDMCRAIDPTVRTAFLCIIPPEDAAELMVRKGHAALHPWDGLVDQDLVASCHARGVDINVWTVDDAQRMRQLAEWGVDGLCSNLPDVAITVLRDLGLR